MKSTLGFPANEHSEKERQKTTLHLLHDTFLEQLQSSLSFFFTMFVNKVVIIAFHPHLVFALFTGLSPHSFTFMQKFYPYCKCTQDLISIKQVSIRANYIQKHPDCCTQRNVLQARYQMLHKRFSLSPTVSVKITLSIAMSPGNVLNSVQLLPQRRYVYMPYFLHALLKQLTRVKDIDSFFYR